MADKTHDEREDANSVQGDQAARRAGSVEDDVTLPDRATEAIEDPIPGDDGDGH